MKSALTFLALSYRKNLSLEKKIKFIEKHKGPQYLVNLRKESQLNAKFFLYTTFAATVVDGVLAANTLVTNIQASFEPTPPFKTQDIINIYTQTAPWVLVTYATYRVSNTMNDLAKMYQTISDALKK